MSALKSALARLAEQGLIENVTVLEQELNANPKARCVAETLHFKDAKRFAARYNSPTQIIQTNKNTHKVYVIK
jgi:hypothetical protein